MKKILTLLSVLTLLLLAIPQGSYAVPSFARQTGYACNTCHTVPPMLTRFGMTFKIRGYTDGQAIQSFDIGGSGLSSFNPVSLRVLNSYSKEKDKDAEVASPETLMLIFGGKVSDNVGALIQPMFEERMGWGIETARFAITKEYRNTLVGLMGGLTSPVGTDPFNTLDPARLIVRQKTSPNEGVSGNGLLDIFNTKNRGASVYALIGDTVYANLGAYTGSSVNKMGEAINKGGSDPADIYGRVAYLTSGVADINIGAFAYTGNEKYSSDPALMVGFEDSKVSRYGIDFGAQKGFGDYVCELTGLYLTGRDEPKDMMGERSSVDTKGFNLLGSIYYRSKIALAAGYGEYKFDDANPLAAVIPQDPDTRRDATVHLSYMFRPNVRFGAEYTDTNWEKSEDTNRTSLILDLNF